MARKHFSLRLGVERPERVNSGNDRDAKTQFAQEKRFEADVPSFEMTR